MLFVLFFLLTQNGPLLHGIRQNFIGVVRKIIPYYSLRWDILEIYPRSWEIPVVAGKTLKTTYRKLYTSLNRVEKWLSTFFPVNLKK